MKTSLSSLEFCDVYISSLKKTNASFARDNRRREETRFDDDDALFVSSLRFRWGKWCSL